MTTFLVFFFFFFLTGWVDDCLTYQCWGRAVGSHELEDGQRFWAPTHTPLILFNVFTLLTSSSYSTLLDSEKQVAILLSSTDAQILKYNFLCFAAWVHVVLHFHFPDMWGNHLLWMVSHHYCKQDYYFSF